ncbi:MAG: TIGR01777 family oxidoreductase [Bryobacteraceae bacterium]
MHVAISGASGFIGRRLIRVLEDGKHTVLKLTRGPAKSGQRQWDPMKEEPDLRTDPPLDAVVHLAGEPVSQRWNEAVKRKIRDSRILGTRNLVRGLAKLETKPRVLVNASAVGLYGERGEQLLDETAGAAPGFLADVCRGWEVEADRAADLGVRVVKIRIGLVLGRGGGALPKMLPPFRLGLGAKLGDGSQWMSWIHLDDLVGMILFALERDAARGPWNGVAPNPVTNAEFTRQLASAVHRPAVFAAPEFLVKLAAGEMAEILFFSQRCIPAAPLAAGFQFRYPELGPALRDVLS